DVQGGGSILGIAPPRRIHSPDARIKGVAVEVVLEGELPARARRTEDEAAFQLLEGGAIGAGPCPCRRTGTEKCGSAEHRSPFPRKTPVRVQRPFARSRPGRTSFSLTRISQRARPFRHRVCALSLE